MKKKERVLISLKILLYTIIIGTSLGIGISMVGGIEYINLENIEKGLIGIQENA